MEILQKITIVIDWLNEKIGQGIAWLTSLLVLVVCYDVFSRYLLNKSYVAMQELEWHLFALIFLLAAAYTLKDDKHVRVDVFYTTFSEQKKAWVNLFGSLFFLLPFCFIAITAAFSFVENAYRFSEGSPNPGGLPLRYLLKSAIPLGFFLLALQGLSLICKSIVTLKRNREKEVAK